MSVIGRARTHLLSPGPTNTCLSNGVQRWSKESRIPQVGNGTPSVTLWRLALRSRRFAHGWRYYRKNMAGVRVGDVVDWGGIGIFHVSVVDHIDERGYIRTIGSGGPTRKVNYQPQGGGHNPPGTFRGYARPPKLKRVHPAKSPAVAVAAAAAPAPVPKVADNILGSGERLESGEKLLAGQFMLTMQTDGSLVLYRNPPAGARQVVWAVHGEPGSFAAMQTDGNFVLYQPRAGRPAVALWSTRTNNKARFGYLTIKADGALVLHKRTGQTVWQGPPK